MAWSGLPSLDWRHPEIATDLPRQVVADLGVPRYRGSLVEGSVLPPRMAATLAHKFAALRLQIRDQLVSLHMAIRSSVY
jgi:hypothetical protein